jgi:hypothetical protein
MSGPIVRTGTNPKFWNNWDNVFGNKKKGAAKPTGKNVTEKKAAAPVAAKKSAKKAAAKKTATKKGK